MEENIINAFKFTTKRTKSGGLGSIWLLNHKKRLSPPPPKIKKRKELELRDKKGWRHQWLRKADISDYESWRKNGFQGY